MKGFSRKFKDFAADFQNSPTTVPLAICVCEIRFEKATQSRFFFFFSGVSPRCSPKRIYDTVSFQSRAEASQSIRSSKRNNPRALHSCVHVKTESSPYTHARVHTYIIIHIHINTYIRVINTYVEILRGTSALPLFIESAMP